MNAICKVAVQDPTFRRSCEVLLAVVFQSFNEIRFSPNVRRFFRSTVQAQGKKLAKWRVSSWLQTAQALKFNIALVRSTMRSRYTIHAIVKYKIDLHSTNTQINKQYLQRIEYLYFISKIIIFGRAKDFVARSKRFSIEYNYCYENHQTMWSIREFKKLRRQLQRKRHIKIELCVGFSVLRLFQVVHDEQIGEVHFPLLGTNGFHAKAKNERFIGAGSLCRQNFKNENFTSSCGRLRQILAPKSVLHVQHEYISTFFVALSCSLPTLYLLHGL